jgi:hypothetical protein
MTVEDTVQRIFGDTLYDYRGIITGVAQRQRLDESGNAGRHAQQVLRPDRSWALRLGNRLRRAAGAFLE